MLYALSALLGAVMLGSEILLLKAVSSMGGTGVSLLLLPVLFFAVALGTLFITVSQPARAYLVERGMGAFVALSLIFVSLAYPLEDMRFIFVLGSLALFILGMVQATLYYLNADRLILTASFTVGLLLANVVSFSLDAFDPRRVLFGFGVLALGTLLLCGRKPRELMVHVLSLLLLTLLTRPMQNSSQFEFSNSFSSFRVYWAGELVNLEERDLEEARIGSEFSESQDTRGNLYLIERGRNRPVQLFDLKEESDLPLLERYAKNSIVLAFMDQVEKGRTALIGTGGGREILLAQRAQFERIFALEINPLMVDMTRTFSRNFALTYGAPNVTTLMGDARREFEQSRELRDLDFITLLSTKAYGRGFSQTLDENPLLTKEAFQTVARRLNSDGILLFARHHAGKVDKPIISAAAEGLRAVAQPGDEIAVAESRERDYFLAFKRGGFTRRQKGQLVRRLEDLDFDVFFTRANRFRVDRELRTQLTPTDDRPFAHAFIWDGLFHIPAIAGGLLLLAWVALLRAPRRLQALGSGALLGFGAMGVQTVLISRMVYSFGYPGLLPPAILSAFSVMGILGYVWERYRPCHSYASQMAWAGLASGLAVTLLAFGYSMPDHLAVLSLVVMAISVSGFFTARAFAGVLREFSDDVGWLLFANGLGMLFGGILVKVVAVANGYWIASALVVGALLIHRLVLIIPSRPLRN